MTKTLKAYICCVGYWYRYGIHFSSLSSFLISNLSERLIYFTWSIFNAKNLAVAESIELGNLTYRIDFSKEVKEYSQNSTESKNWRKKVVKYDGIPKLRRSRNVRHFSSFVSTYFPSIQTAEEVFEEKLYPDVSARVHCVSCASVCLQLKGCHCALSWKIGSTEEGTDEVCSSNCVEQ